MNYEDQWYGVRDKYIRAGMARQVTLVDQAISDNEPITILRAMANLLKQSPNNGWIARRRKKKIDKILKKAEKKYNAS